MIANADPKLNYVPAWMINFALKNVCGVFLTAIENKS